MNIRRFLMACLLSMSVLPVNAQDEMRSPQLDKLTLPPGFSIEVYAADVPNARQMALSPTGTVFVSTRQAGDVYAVRDDDGDQSADQVFVLDSDLNMPNGVAFHDGDLYVAEINRVLRYDDIESHLDAPPEPVVLNDSLPTERAHGTNIIAIGPYGP